MLGMKNTFAKTLLMTFFIFVFFRDTHAQNCDLSVQTAPILLKLKTQMSPEQVQAVFGKDLKIKIKKNGERIFFQNYIKKPAPESLKNVRAIYLRFFDRKLYQAEIFYEPRPDFPTLEAVTNRLAEQLNFSAENWKIENRYAEISCGENSLRADNILNPHIELTDEFLLKKVLDARKTGK